MSFVSMATCSSKSTPRSYNSLSTNSSGGAACKRYRSPPWQVACSFTGVDHGHGFVPAPGRGHDSGRDHVHAHGHGMATAFHTTGFDRPFLLAGALLQHDLMAAVVAVERRQQTIRVGQLGEAERALGLEHAALLELQVEILLEQAL